MDMTWEAVQAHSDEVLSDGIYQLMNGEAKSLAEVTYNGYGNYLISHQATPVYIGEAKNIKSRLKQHASMKTSTFYKNYVNMQESLSDHLPMNLAISDFDCQYIPTEIGRKDMEEFGIVSIPTKLNKFQLDKRPQYSIQSHDNLWQDVQIHKNILMELGESQLKQQPFITWYDANPPKQAGIYWIEHCTDGLIYIGESSDVAKRYRVHSRRTYFSAFRRNLGQRLLDFELKTINNKKRYFSEQEDEQLNKFLKQCNVRFMIIPFGRYELEEYLIDKYQPILNHKGKKPL